LQFDSNFEGGNLHCVFKHKSSGCYYLLLQNDINTHGFTIWFHFNVKAFQPGTYQLVIANLAKEIRFEQETSLLTFSSKNS
jgi:cytosolic carboxypeptidase protein 2/3